MYKTCLSILFKYSKNLKKKNYNLLDLNLWTSMYDKSSLPLALHHKTSQQIKTKSLDWATSPEWDKQTTPSIWTKPHYPNKPKKQVFGPNHITRMSQTNNTKSLDWGTSPKWSKKIVLSLWIKATSPKQAKQPTSSL